MPHHRARPNRYRPTNPFSLSDYERLQAMLRGKPAEVLARFAECNIGCLEELDTYHRLRHTDSDAAIRIAAMAQLMGIPLSPVEDKDERTH